VGEYQYYEFLAIDRPLDTSQLEELRALSTRARISPTSFVNTYHWGDFKGDPQMLMARYFDASLYLANWGTRRLMIRLPSSLLDLQTARDHCVGESACAWPAKDNVIVELNSEEAEGYWEDSDEASLATIVPVRSELAGGDQRLLYLAWLLSVDAGELDGDALEPCVPRGLASLSKSLQSLVEFLRIDEDLLVVAAEMSEPLITTEPSTAELTRLVTRLPEQDKNTLLARLAAGEPHLRMELVRRFRGETHPAVDGSGARTVAELRDAAASHRTRREQLVAGRQAQEKARRERAEAAAYERRLATLAKRQEEAWKQVYAAIDTCQPSRYDMAIELLKDLRAISEREQRIEAFERQLLELRQMHSKKHSLLQRLDRGDLGAKTRSPHEEKR
jgi:hypothetical protein